MATRGQFNTKNPTIKRILKEASELASQPSPDYHAEPLEDNLLEWHFTLRGPPEPSPYANGIYHGRIVLPSQYPLRPPSFRFLTPTGRFEVNREICLSISGHHEETWQPAWGIRTALVAMRSFMDTDAKGQLGGLECGKDVRERLAGEGRNWRCAICAKSNVEVLQERKEMFREKGDEAKNEEAVPEELRLAYRDELGAKKEDGAKVDKGKRRAVGDTPTSEPPPPPAASTAATIDTSVPGPAPTRTIPTARVQQLVQQSPDRSPPWIDTCIYGVVAALLFMVLRKLYL